MEATTAAPNNGRLAWAVLCKTPSGKGEVVRVTDHEDADAAVRENPELFWKSGPFVLPY
jgi:hypothetical protein